MLELVVGPSERAAGAAAVPGELEHGQLLGQDFAAGDHAAALDFSVDQPFVVHQAEDGLGTGGADGELEGLGLEHPLGYDGRSLENVIDRVTDRLAGTPVVLRD